MLFVLKAVAKRNQNARVFLGKREAHANQSPQWNFRVPKIYANTK